ncbi:MAG: hypothetical protein WC537_00885 [Candidatus Paceibacterota bacterium]|jgi:hypothetical protein
MKKEGDFYFPFCETALGLPRAFSFAKKLACLLGREVLKEKEKLAGVASV